MKRFLMPFLLLLCLSAASFADTVSVSALHRGNAYRGQITGNGDSVRGQIIVRYADGRVFVGVASYLETLPGAAYAVFVGRMQDGTEAGLLLEVEDNKPEVEPDRLYPVLLLVIPEGVRRRLGVDPWLPGRGSHVKPLYGWGEAVKIVREQ